MSARAGWDADGPEFRWAMRVVLAIATLLPASFLFKLLTNHTTLYPDFFGIWSFGRYVRLHPPASIYDDQALHAFQASFGMPATDSYPFPYPPWILLLLAPVGALPYAVARVGWAVLSVGCAAAAVRAWRWPRPLAALLLVAPSSAICLVVGQNGFLSAALMLGGLGLLRPRPFLAGMLLGAVGYKPQLAILIPFFLLFGLHWRAIAGAALCAATLTAASGLVFGAGIWQAWWLSMQHQAASLSTGRPALLDMMPTITSAVLLLGGGAIWAHACQAVAALGGLAAVWTVRRRHDAAAHAVLPVATLLATPYAFHYDLPIVTGALIAVIAARIADAGRFGGLELPLLLGCIGGPALLAAQSATGAVLMPALFCATLWVLARQASVADRR